jgi:hypothetical protein
VLQPVEITLDTVAHTPEENACLILDYLIRQACVRIQADACINDSPCLALWAMGREGALAKLSIRLEVVPGADGQPVWEMVICQLSPRTAVEDG